MKLKPSARIIRHFKTIAYWAAKLDKSSTCYRAKEDAGIEFTEEERAKLNEASKLFRQAKDLVTGVYSARIGATVAQEIRWGA